MRMQLIYKYITVVLLLLSYNVTISQETDTTAIYKKRVLETTEVDFLFSYYEQDGNNAAVSGGIGTEKLTDATPTFVISIPLNDDDVLTIDAGISAYTSASSSNVNPFDTHLESDPFTASSGASGADTWFNVSGTYAHSSDDRNKVWSGKVSISSEYDYFSAGIGGTYTRLFNKKNTELSFTGNIFFDQWTTIYPSELRPFNNGNPNGLDAEIFQNEVITGGVYNPNFQGFIDKGRNSFSAGASLIQILSKRAQGALLLDVVQQQGLLSTPFQRVYFSDVDSSFIDNFRLADDIERLPDNRLKTAVGGRFNFYVNEYIVLKSYYRYYRDSWGISSNTASIEVPLKVSSKFTLYPSYRYYNQTAADYFAPYAEHLSTDEFYTSDYDLSEYNANQYSLGLSYTDIFTKKHIGKYGLKSIDLKYSYYERNTGLQFSIVSFGVKFILDKPIKEEEK